MEDVKGKYLWSAVVLFVNHEGVDDCDVDLSVVTEQRDSLQAITALKEKVKEYGEYSGVVGLKCSGQFGGQS